MSFSFESLEVYKKAIAVSEKISNITDTFPRGNYYLIDHLNRAALSISTNLAEGNSRWDKKERKHFFWRAREAAQECVPVLEVCMRKKLIGRDACVTLKKDLLVIVKMTQALVKGMEKQFQEAKLQSN